MGNDPVEAAQRPWSAYFRLSPAGDRPFPQFTIWQTPCLFPVYSRQCVGSPQLLQATPSLRPLPLTTWTQTQTITTSPTAPSPK